MPLTIVDNAVDFVTDALHDLKAVDVVILGVSHLTTITDHMIIASGTSKQHVRSIANHVRVSAKHSGMNILGFEGEAQGEWVLLDLGDVVVHVMTPEIRDYYQIEKLWNIDEIDNAAS